jgi:regulator of protease activity HflC (stomatin/prohibitin superfamily)
VFYAVRILREYERGVVFQLGRFWAVKGPGLIIVIPGVQQMVKVDIRTVTMDVPPQDVISKDNVSVKVNAVIYFRVVDPQRAIIQVENYPMATSQLAQTTLRAVLGKHDLDDMLAEREKLNLDIRKALDVQTDAWGIKVSNVEIKHIDLNETMVRAMARQAEAERERRSKIILAEGELQASQKLLQAAQTLCNATGGDAATLPADADRDRRGSQQHHRLPGGHARLVDAGARQGPVVLRATTTARAAEHPALAVRS